MMLVDESAILYAIWLSSGESPIFMNIGTKIGAMIAHLAEADPINRLMKADRMIKRITNGTPVNFIDSKNSAPFTDRIVPRFV